MKTPLANMPKEQRADMLKQGTEKIKNMDDQQLKQMVDMMKNNKEQMKAMYKS